MPLGVPEVLRDAVLTVELAGLPPVRVDLAEAAAPGEASPVLSALRPRVTLTQGNVVWFRRAPYGNPEDGLPLGLIGLAALGLVAFVLLSRGG